MSTVLGLVGLTRQERRRVLILLPAFEMAMPLLGLLGGALLGRLLGDAAEYVAASVLVALGVWMLVGEGHERERIAGLARGRGLAILALGIGISLDELAIGFSIGLLDVSPAAAVLLIGAQAFVMAFVGLRIGARLGGAAGQWAERIASIALIVLGAGLLVEQLA